MTDKHEKDPYHTVKINAWVIVTLIWLNELYMNADYFSCYVVITSGLVTIDFHIQSLQLP